MKNSITKKLILIIFSLIASLLIGFMIFQSFFFQGFYLQKKSEDLQNSLLQFKRDYDYNWPVNTQAVINAMTTFELNNTAKIAICPIDSNISKITVSQKNNEDIDATLDSILNKLKEQKLYTQEFLNSSKIITTVVNTKGNSKQIVSIAPFSLSSKNDAVIISISPFRTIEEASAIMKDFYEAIILLLIIFCFFFAYIFSNLISKPLLKLNETAKKMISMDFTEKCDVTSNDEIGNLATSLNFLSSSLSSALDDLKLKNAYLEEEIRKEREIEKLRKDFIASVSHELKTPIGIISGYAEGIKDGIVDSENLDFYLDVIIDESNKMNKLVLEMLNLSKLEAKKVQLTLSEFSLSTLTEDIISKHKHKFDENNLKVNLDLIPDSEAKVLADSFKIEQVISNFVTNAIKYTPSGENVNVKVSDLEDKVLFSIENTGVSIEEKHLSKIWSQFYRIDSSRNRDSGSYGLGLSIAKNLLELHNSQYGVVHTDKGIEFYFYLEKLKN